LRAGVATRVGRSAGVALRGSSAAALGLGAGATLGSFVLAATRGFGLAGCCSAERAGARDGWLTCRSSAMLDTAIAPPTATTLTHFEIAIAPPHFAAVVDAAVAEVAEAEAEAAEAEAVTAAPDAAPIPTAASVAASDPEDGWSSSAERKSSSSSSLQSESESGGRSLMAEALSCLPRAQGAAARLP
jgi:hypothetical protein